MKIILINPPPHRQVEKYDLATWQHLGIGRISSYVKQFGYDVTIIDAKLQRLNIDQVLKIIEESKPDVVGLTAMTPDIYNAYSLARGIKSINKKIIIVIGGCHATVMPENTLKEESCIDYLVFGEGERTFKELLDVISTNISIKLLSQINGIVFRNGNKIIKTKIRIWNTNLKELPLPDWQLSPYTSSYKLETSRGCPFKCNYCMRVLGETVRFFPIQNVLNEFKHIMQLKDKLSVEIVDETFTLNQERLNKLLDGMIKIGVGKKIKWWCSTRANLISRELLKKMKRAGCWRITYGVESGNQQILDRIPKNIKLEDISKAIKLTREVGIKSCASFILGHPNEKLNDMIDTINFATRINADFTFIGTMVPYPKTGIAKIIERGEGNYKLLSKNWTTYNRQFSYVLELNNISKGDMDKLQLICMLKVYLYNLRFLELIKFTFEYRREAFKFFKMIFLPKTEEKRNISKSKVSFIQLIKIFFSKYKTGSV